MKTLKSVHLIRTAGALAAAPLLAVTLGTQPSFAAARGIDTYTSDQAPGGRVAATISWQRSKKNGPYAGRVYGTVFDRDGRDEYCALAQVSLDGSVNNVGRACAKDREVGFSFPFKRTRQALARVCLARGGKLVNCSEWK